MRVAWTRVGKGVFARLSYPATAIIGEITGEIIDDPNYGSDYCFDIGEGRHLEPVPPFRFVNHSCEPNCEFDYCKCGQPGEERQQVFLIALRNICKGEELTIDYNWRTPHPIRCQCQAPSCRGWVIGEDWIDEVTRSEVGSLS